MIINGTTVRAFGYLAHSCFQAKYPNPNRNSFWQVAVSWEFFQILRALLLNWTRIDLIAAFELHFVPCEIAAIERGSATIQ